MLFALALCKDWFPLSMLTYSVRGCSRCSLLLILKRGIVALIWCFWPRFEVKVLLEVYRKAWDFILTVIINYIYHFFWVLAKFWNCDPIIIENSIRPSIIYLFLPYFIIAYLGFFWNSLIACMYSGFENNFWTFSFFSTLFRKLLVIQSFLVS